MSRKSGAPDPRRDPHKIELTRAAVRGLERLPKPVLKRVDARILALAEDQHPPGSKKLEGPDDITRIRVGDYRILYQVEAKRVTVVVVDVGNRRDVYRSP